MKKTTSIIWGIALVAIGVVLGLNAFGVTDIELFFDGWWTLFIIVPSAVGLFREKDKTGSIIGILIGAFLLLCCQDVIDFDMIWKLALPAIIIIIGIKLIFGNAIAGKFEKAVSKNAPVGENLKSICAIFSSQNANYDSQVFDGAEINAVFGGAKCDLRNAIIESDCVINATSIFGGIDIYLPDDVNVKVNSNSIFGGVSNKRNTAYINGAFTVYINATCMFGGVDIK